MGVTDRESHVTEEKVVVDMRIMDVAEVEVEQVEDHVGRMIDGNREVTTEVVSVEAMNTVDLARRGKDVSTGAEGHALPHYVRAHR